MNKTLHIAASATAATLIAITASCGNKQVTASADSESLATVELSWADSITANNCTAKSSAAAQYPSEGSHALLDSTRSWIAQCLTTIMPVDTAAASASFPASLLADGEKLIADAGTRFLTEARTDFDSFDPADGFRLNYEYQAEVNKTFDTDSVVTFTASTYIYTGGAHGATLFNAATFRTSDGAALGYDIFEQDNLPELTQMVKDAVAKQYFETGDDFKMEDALIIDPQDFRLPSTPPYFTKDGLS
ncbi:MAG: DUF4163 domain-containing protein, partial [Muribaculaceae bacterium]|nr:DUF4163 domain-containing protein [Muribaculaceae bacterium]